MISVIQTGSSKRDHQIPALSSFYFCRRKQTQFLKCCDVINPRKETILKTLIRAIYSSIQGFDGGDPMDRHHLQDLGVDGKIILKWIFKKWYDSRYEPVAGAYECANEPSGSIKCGEFLD
jgi:hypothetical protein